MQDHPDHPHAEHRAQIAELQARLAAAEARLAAAEAERDALAALVAGAPARAEQLHSILSGMPVMLDAFDEQGRLVVWNAECERVTGYSAAELLGRADVIERLYPDPDYRARIYAERSAHGATYRNWELTLTRKDGEQRIIAWSNISQRVPVPGWSFWAVGVDVTEQRRSEERLRLAFEAASMIAWERDLATDWVEWMGDPAVALGAGGRRVDRATLAAYFPPEDLAAVREAMLATPAGEKVRIEHRYYRSDASLGWVESFAHIVGGPGERLRVVGVSRDITRRVRLQDELRRREEQFATLVENSPDVIFRHRIAPDLAYEYVSPAATALLGYPPAAFMADPHFLERIAHPDDRPVVARINAERRMPQPFEIRLRHREGRLIWVQLNTSPIYAADGGLAAFEGVLHDITAHKLLEQALLRQARLQSTLAASLRALHGHGHDGAARQRILTVVAAELRAGVGAAHILILAREAGGQLRLAGAAPGMAEALGAPVGAPALEPPGAPAPRPVPAFAAVGGASAGYHLLPIAWPGADWGLVAIGVAPGADLDAESLALAATVAEMLATTTRRWLAVDALQESERRHRLAVAAAQLGTWELHIADDALSLSAEGARLLGLGDAPVRVPLQRLLDVVHPDDHALVSAMRGQAAADDAQLRLQLRVRRPDGAPRWVQLFGQAQGEPGRPAVRLLGVSLDVTAQRAAQEAIRELNLDLERRVQERTRELEQTNAALRQEIADRKRAEAELAAAVQQLDALNAELRRSDSLLRTIVDNLDDGLALIGADGRVLMVNQSLTRLCRLEPAVIIDRPWQEVCPFNSPLIDQALAATLAYSGRERVVRDSAARVLDIQAIPLAGAGDTLQMVLHIVDVTERLQFEELALNNERLAATGRLAAVVAHEVNSPLQAIQNFLFLAASDDPTERDGYLAMISDEIDRIGGLIRRLLDLQRPGDDSVRELDANALVARVLRLTSSTMGRHHVRVIPDLAALPLPLQGRSDQLTQVLLNLILNALDAMPHGGELLIRSQLRPRGPADALAPGAPPLVVELEVHDTGHGIPEELLPRIFESFFTTKATGSGLGLAISSQIVEQHGGRLSARNGPGGGAQFRVVLPAAAPDQPGAPPAPCRSG